MGSRQGRTRDCRTYDGLELDPGQTSNRIVPALRESNEGRTASAWSIEFAGCETTRQRLRLSSQTCSKKVIDPKESIAIGIQSRFCMDIWILSPVATGTARPLVR